MGGCPRRRNEIAVTKSMTADELLRKLDISRCSDKLSSLLSLDT